jgi:pimeloyl-ACP methyl ester carboxylesterase
MDALEQEARYQLEIAELEEGPIDPEGFRPIAVGTSRGRIELRYYAAVRPRAGVVWMGGVGGGWDTPARGLYPELCRELQAKGLSSCRVRFRDPRSLPESVLDALVGVRFLVDNGCVRIGMVGHSSGGAVAVQAAANATVIRTVVTLATQTYGAMSAGDLAAGQSVLLIHGAADEILPPSSSRSIHALVPGHKRLVIIDGAGHNLDEAAGEVSATVRSWLLSQLGGNGLAVDT